MADSIKGKAYNAYSGDLRRGILLHRKIDSFTDSHPIAFKSSHRLFKKYRHYSGVIVDVFYDHFLAKNWADYHPDKLADYTADFYALLKQHHAILPPNVQRFYPYMIAQNWLLSYAEILGIERILTQMNNRVINTVKLNESIVELRENYALFEAEFREFFPALQDYVLQEKQRLQEV